MARGKHKARAQSRRQNTLEATRAQLQAELSTERAALTEAQAVLAEIEKLEQKLSSENTNAHDEVEPFARSLREERDYLQSLYAEARVHHGAIKDAWSRYSDAALDVSEGATPTEKIESFMRVLGVDGWIADPDSKRARSLQAVTRIQRAQGVRRNVSNTSEEQSKEYRLTNLLNSEGITSPVLLPSLRRRLVDADLIKVEDDGHIVLKPESGLNPEQLQDRAEAIDTAERVRNCRLSSFRPHEILGWGTGVLLAQSDTETIMDRLLGTDRTKLQSQAPASLLTALPLPLPSTTATSRSEIASQPAEKILDAWNEVFRSRSIISEKLALPTSTYAALTHHPHPSHGLALQLTYASASFARWLQDTSEPAIAQVAVGLTAAASYWLPAGQTASFAESEPLSEEDKTEMILPFPQVFLSFAEPLILDAVEPRRANTEERWRLLSEIAALGLKDDTKLGDIIDERLRVATEDWSTITVEEFVGQLGAQIEGVLLLSDSLGQPDDLFAWCLTVPGAYGASLGRFVVPARRSKTDFRDTIDNLTAVVAWAQWHEPDHETTIPLNVPFEDVEILASTTEFKRNARRTGVGLRVVNVGSIHRRPAASRTNDSDVKTSAHVIPHIRRGHWRLQRYGEGLKQFKRVRIAPVLVNAHRGDLVARVYRLPTRKAEE